MKLKNILFEGKDVRKLHGNYRTQIHLSRSKSFEFNPVENVRTNKSHNKPYEGLWTSTMFKTEDGKASSSWWEFFKDKPFNIIDFDYVHLLTVQGNPEKLEINSFQTARETASEYEGETFGGDKYIDWNSVSEEYDCVHVYGSALNHPLFVDWDVESTVWFDPTYLKKELTWEIREKGND